MRLSTAIRGAGVPPHIRSSKAPAFGPEMRITATPARPGALDSAQIVWVSAIRA
jgi:hypothetical protein